MAVELSNSRVYDAQVLRESGGIVDDRRPHTLTDVTALEAHGHTLQDYIGNNAAGLSKRDMGAARGYMDEIRGRSLADLRILAENNIFARFFSNLSAERTPNPLATTTPADVVAAAERINREAAGGTVYDARPKNTRRFSVFSRRRSG